MNETPGAVAHFEKWTDDERMEIVEEANRILADAAFKNSKRCLSLFRYLLDRSLAGDHEGVKERTLGVEVFGRPLDYDTAIDPVVRITANEIRKRLAQWYQESANHRQVRFRLTPGAYLLTFEFVQPALVSVLLEANTGGETPRLAGGLPTEGPSVRPAATLAAPRPNDESVLISAVSPSTASSKRKWLFALAAAGIVALVFVSFFRASDVLQGEDYLAWKPLLSSTKPLTLSITDEPAAQSFEPGSDPQSVLDTLPKGAAILGATQQDALTMTPVSYAVVSQNITDWLASHGRTSVLRGSSAVSLQELRQGPVVLIGGFNPWSLRLLSNLRYSIRADRDTHTVWIQDAQNASKRNWIIDGSDQPRDIDYAVITRFINPETGNWILSLGGLRQQGTEAAKDLLVDSSFEQILPKQIRSKGNFQIVLKTNIINGCAGPPQVLAIHTW